VAKTSARDEATRPPLVSLPRSLTISSFSLAVNSRKNLKMESSWLKIFI